MDTRDIRPVVLDNSDKESVNTTMDTPLVLQRTSNCDDKKPAGEIDSRFLWIGLGTLSILIFAPWLFFLSLLGFVLGFCSLELVNQHIRPLIIGQLKRKISEERNYDPLLHPDDADGVTGSTTCLVCNVENCSRDSHHARPQLKTSWSNSGTGLSQDLRIDPRLDAAIARFFKAVFEVYVSPDWAPYETRLELKRILVKTLLTFGQGVQETFFSNEQDSKVFIRRKVLPLLLFHVNSIKDGVHITSEEEAEAYQKVLALTRILLKRFLNPEDAKCKLWTELALSVLGSGVFWNLILIGRTEIPDLVAELMEERKQSIRSESSSVRTPGEEPVTLTPKEEELVSLLLDSFLDPAKDVEQPSAIFSRYRPTLNYVLKESDLLYCLIQFLKGEGALDWLQAVLDQDPTNAQPSSFPRKVIEIKHLNHFARSRVFLENLGFSRVEPAFEVDPDLHLSSSTKSTSNHTRSSSYGGGASGGIWDQKVVEGLAIYPLLNQPIRASIPQRQSTNVSPPGDSESLFRRRHTLEPFIVKFYASLHEPNEKECISDIPPVKQRVGAEPKARRRSSSFKRVVISEKPKDVLDTLTSTVISLMRKDCRWKGVFAGWIQFLRPLLNEKFTEVLDELTGKALALDNVLFFINLITDAFVLSQSPEAKEEKKGKTQPSASEQQGTFLSNSSQVHFLNPDWLLESLFDTEELLQRLKSHPDGILLFFVDLLDLLVSALTSPHIHE